MPIGIYETKEHAIIAGVGIAKVHEKGQLLIHTQDGKIEDERTYGADPRSSKG